MSSAQKKAGRKVNERKLRRECKVCLWSLPLWLLEVEQRGPLTTSHLSVFGPWLLPGVCMDWHLQFDPILPVFRRHLDVCEHKHVWRWVELPGKTSAACCTPVFNIVQQLWMITSNTVCFEGASAPQFSKTLQPVSTHQLYDSHASGSK